MVTVSCHELTLLEISGITAATDELLFQLAEHCPKLSHLGIKGCRQVRTGFLLVFACLLLPDSMCVCVCVCVCV